MHRKTLEERVFLLLKEKGYQLSSAESCTAGLFAGRFMNTPGTSAVYKEGYITYSNAAKNTLLGVSKELLDTHGAVSRQCAYAMARGTCMAAGSECGIGITGIAGPDGGTKEKPVGLVYIGCCINGHIVVRKCQFHGNRQRIRKASVTMALRMLYEALKKEE
jgi:PncC family amidohydrolase